MHRAKRFCLIALTGKDLNPTTIDFFYFGHELSDLYDKERRVSLKFYELELYSPNTLAPPIFHNSKDYAIAKRIYSTFGIFINKKNNLNRWKAAVKRMYSLSDTGVDFKKNFQLTLQEKKERIRIYSGKNIFQYNHRFATHADGQIKDSSNDNLLDAYYSIESEYYIISVHLKQAE